MTGGAGHPHTLRGSMGRLLILLVACLLVFRSELQAILHAIIRDPDAIHGVLFPVLAWLLLRLRAGELAAEGINEAIAVLSEDLPQPAWDNHSHTGHWRHVVFRQGEQLVVDLVTHPDADEAQVAAVAQRLGALEHVGGVVGGIAENLGKGALKTVEAAVGMGGDPDLQEQIDERKRTAFTAAAEWVEQQQLD